MSTDVLASGTSISIRNLAQSDFAAISHFEYSVSISEPHSDPARLAEIYEESSTAVVVRPAVFKEAWFLREGVLRSCGFGDGDPADCFVYSRTMKDYSQEKASSNGPG